MTESIVTFQKIVTGMANLLDQTPEEVIRQLVNSKWDIRGCLDYKDIISVTETELEDNAENYREFYERSK